MDFPKAKVLLYIQKFIFRGEKTINIHISACNSFFRKIHLPFMTVIYIRMWWKQLDVIFLFGGSRIISYFFFSGRRIISNFLFGDSGLISHFLEAE